MSSSGGVERGGMWLPSQLSDPAHQDELSRLGFELPPESYSNLRSLPLGAILRVGGCSGSFVSNAGLILTNHHCVRSFLLEASQNDENLLDNGFIASNRSLERRIPSLVGVITLSSIDVTDTVLGSVNDKMNPMQREEALMKKSMELEQACQAKRPGIGCRVVSFFDRNHFELQESQRIQDLRLVYVPQEGLGWFGGQNDNWRWPRQTADFAFLRAYGPNGQPLQSNQHLRIATKALAPQDPVMVAGYPGRTTRYQSGSQVKFAQDKLYPYLIERFEGHIQALKKVTAQNPALSAVSQSSLFALNNQLTSYKAIVEGLNRSKFADERIALDAQLEQWIQASPERKTRFGSVIADISQAQQSPKQGHIVEQDLQALEQHSILLERAIAIVREARSRAEGTATESWQVEDFKSQLIETSKPTTYARPLDQAATTYLLTRIFNDQPSDRAYARALLGKSTADPLSIADINTFVASSYASTKLEDLAAAAQLYEHSTPEALQKSEDLLIQMALRFVPIHEMIQARDAQGYFELVRRTRLYTKARLEYAQSKGRLSAPDANSTLRISYGQVKGYQAPQSAQNYTAFSTSAELLAKNTGVAPFNLPPQVASALTQRDFGPYSDPRLGDLPINFLADTHLTGGNSGSAVLNAKGELTGLAFDINYEGVLSDWFFDPTLARSIQVDIRFIQWVLDIGAPAHHLLNEMGLKPSTKP